MTIFPTAAGPLLCLSPQDLPAGQPLTDDTLLPLVRRTLIQNGQAAAPRAGSLPQPGTGVGFCPSPSASGRTGTKAYI